MLHQEKSGNPASTVCHRRAHPHKKSLMKMLAGTEANGKQKS
jgi:hypothetical protein